MIKIIPKKHCTVVSDQSHPQKKQCKTVKWLSEEALQIAEERREAKSKGEMERYTQLNAEFQRITRKIRGKTLQRSRGKQ